MLVCVVLIKPFLILTPFSQYLVSLIEAKLGWMCVFYFFVVMVRGPRADFGKTAC